jgi:hypothetical protein
MMKTLDDVISLNFMIDVFWVIEKNSID